MLGMSVAELTKLLQRGSPTLVIDVRRRETFLKDKQTIGGALRRGPERVATWARELPSADKVVVYCVHGHEVSQGVAKALSGETRDASYLEGGIAEWRAGGGATDDKPANASTRWVTRERRKSTASPAHG